MNVCHQNYASVTIQNYKPFSIGVITGQHTLSFWKFIFMILETKLILKAYYITSLVIIYLLSLRLMHYFPVLIKHLSVLNLAGYQCLKLKYLVWWRHHTYFKVFIFWVRMILDNYGSVIDGTYIKVKLYLDSHNHVFSTFHINSLW
jgi:hypothetical protein